VFCFKRAFAVKLTALANSKMSFVLSVNFSEFEHQIDFANTISFAVMDGCA